jgi:hypothetical protein
MNPIIIQEAPISWKIKLPTKEVTREIHLGRKQEKFTEIKEIKDQGKQREETKSSLLLIKRFLSL